MGAFRLGMALRAAIAAGALVVIASGSAANAAPLRFQIRHTLSGSVLGSFDSVSNPSTGVIIPGFVSSISYSNPTGLLATARGFSVADVGLKIIVAEGVGDIVSSTGTPLFAGSVASPVFSTGQYTLGGVFQNSTLTISEIRVAPPPPAPGAPAPEVGGGLLAALAAVLAFGLTRGGALRTMERRNC